MTLSSGKCWRPSSDLDLFQRDVGVYFIDPIEAILWDYAVPLDILFQCFHQVPLYYRLHISVSTHYICISLGMQLWICEVMYSFIRHVMRTYKLSLNRQFVFQSTCQTVFKTALKISEDVICLVLVNKINF